jgi:hypothetical protein
MLKDRSVVRRVLVVLGAVLIGVVVVAAIVWRKDTPSPLVVPPVVFSWPDSSVTMQEDDPGWDCATMGNRVCGTEVSAVD